MGANERLGLPRDKMRTIRIAFDVDGTLRCNCKATCESANDSVMQLFWVLHDFKNTELFVWSGGGADYARAFANKYCLPVKDSHCISKIGAPQMDIAIDDIQDTALGTFNLIVRAK